MKSRRRLTGIGRLLVLAIIVAVYIFVSYVLPLPVAQPSAHSTAPGIPAKNSALAWPGFGQTAIGAPGYGVLDSHGNTTPVPIASVAKVLTALAVLKQHPLLKGQQGPSITVSAEDVANYQKITAVDGSVVPVQDGEQLTEYQALQALLLPSANNVADLLANWAFGSQTAYVGFANAFVRSLGLLHTTVADASGFSPKTVSTAPDLVLLAENVMDNPVLAEIVGQAQATIPVAGVIQNVNLLVGHQEVVGIKTGNTDEAGGCFMVAAKHTVDANHQILVITVTLGAPDLATAISSTLPLLQSVYPNFAVKTVVKQGQAVGSYRTPWGSVVPVGAAQDISGVVWQPAPPQVQLVLNPVSLVPGKVAYPQGEVSVTFGRQQISSGITGGVIPPPSFAWRMLHPLRR